MAVACAEESQCIEERQRQALKRDDGSKGNTLTKTFKKILAEEVALTSSVITLEM